MTSRVRLKRKQSTGITLLDAIADPSLFAPWFKKRDTWAAWFAFIASLFALHMSQEQLETYRQCTGRNEAPTEPAREGWLVVGRRGGKSFILAIIAVWLACFRDYRPFLQPGERATVMVIAADRRQARTIIRYVRALLTRIPMLSGLIERETAELFDLSNSVTIEVATASFRSTRGYTLAAVILDELAFFQTDDQSADPDREIIAALRPGLVTIPGALLLCASSPYARKGVLYDAHRKHFAKDGDPILVWNAATRIMNPSVPQSVIDEAYEADPIAAAAEYGALFRSDVSSFIDREVVEACIDRDTYERARDSQCQYRAFTDPSGGRNDSFTLAIAHREEGVSILDCLREVKAPFSPEDVVAEFALLLKSYRISRVVGDRYAGEWPVEAFDRHGITYEQAAKPKSDLYRDLLPAINSKTARLLDHPRLVNQLIGLERRTARGGRDSIDHPPGGHDDAANAVAGVISELSSSKDSYDSTLAWVTDDPHADVSYLQRMAMANGRWR